jgi:hypothetical protein
MSLQRLTCKLLNLKVALIEVTQTTSVSTDNPIEIVNEVVLIKAENI